MSTIEELFRKELRHAETTPPDKIWDNISSRLNGTDVSDAHISKPATAKVKGWLLATTAFLAAGSIVTAIILFSATADNKQGQFLFNQAIKQSSNQNNDMPVEVTEDTLADAPTDDSLLQMTKVAVKDNAARNTVSQVSSIPDAVHATPRKEATCTPAVSVDKNEVGNSQPASISVQSSNQTIKQSSNQTIKQSNTSAVTAEVAKENVPETRTETKKATDNNATSMTAPTSEAVANTDKMDIRKDIDRTLMIPNILTPNGDGYNDCWVIPGRDNYGTFRVSIFNATGKQVYHAANYQNDFCGAGLPDGNYFYLIAIPEKSYTRRGALVIRR